MKTLREVKVGETATVVKLHGEGATEVYNRKVAPLGDPVEITIRGYELSIRKADAELIEIE